MKRSRCAVCFRAIWYADVYGKWLHRKPADAYRSSRYFGGGQHEAKP